MVLLLVLPAATAISAGQYNKTGPAGISGLEPSGLAGGSALSGAVPLPSSAPEAGPEKGSADAPGVTGGNLSDVTYPFIAENATPGTIHRQFSFSFQQRNITIGVNVSAAVYYGARNGVKYALAPPGTAPETLAPDYYRAFVDDPHQDMFYADILRSFRTVRQEYGYSDDDYLELMTVFVQSLPYDTVAGSRPGTPARFPVETIADGTGNCEDKSILLAGLLSREGYNVSLLLFLPEDHMAVGVQGDYLQYRNTGYLYVETTHELLIGDSPSYLNQSPKYVPPGQSTGIVSLTSTPIVIRVGNGTKKFMSAGETAYILRREQNIDNDIAYIRHQLDTFSGDNPLRFKTLMEQYYLYAVVHNHIVEQPYDEAGLFRYLRARPAAACAGTSFSADTVSGVDAGCTAIAGRTCRLAASYAPVAIRLPLYSSLQEARCAFTPAI
jgi:hypothetical protein